ncbi:10053_t:CDS:2 [Dentiscutata heterogama]|uniref:10053_t:CDS:1 n=1 Tax=Dentiscutata heterogama TaxID=1316150 RepID=A0ACA9LJP5_9GLOM|nr:10053_t:CDS:2 [Dentiscutata heterogama]
MSKATNPAKNKYKKVQSTKLGEEQAQESPKHQTRQRTNTRKSKASNPVKNKQTQSKSKSPFLAKNKYKKVQSTKPDEEQTQESSKHQTW